MKQKIDTDWVSRIEKPEISPSNSSIYNQTILKKSCGIYMEESTPFSKREKKIRKDDSGNSGSLHTVAAIVHPALIHIGSDQ